MQTVNNNQETLFSLRKIRDLEKEGFSISINYDPKTDEVDIDYTNISMDKVIDMLASGVLPAFMNSIGDSLKEKFIKNNFQLN